MKAEQTLMLLKKLRGREGAGDPTDPEFMLTSLAPIIHLVPHTEWRAEPVQHKHTCVTDEEQTAEVSIDSLLIAAQLLLLQHSFFLTKKDLKSSPEHSVQLILNTRVANTADFQIHWVHKTTSTCAVC